MGMDSLRNLGGPSFEGVALFGLIAVKGIHLGRHPLRGVVQDLANDFL